MQLNYAFRDEKINIYAMTEGMSSTKYSHQIILCKKSTIPPHGPFLLDPKRSKPIYKFSEYGKKYNHNIGKKKYLLKYIAYIDSYIKIRITYDLFDMLEKNEFFSIWHPEAPFKYFENRKEGYLALFRVFEIDDSIKESILEKGRRGRNFYYNLDHPINVEFIKRVLSDKNFYNMKQNLIDMLKEGNWLINVINNLYEFPLIEECSSEQLIKSEEEVYKKNKDLSFRELSKKIKKRRKINKLKKKISITSVQYLRDEKVSIFAKKRANGFCECCEKEAPFLKKDGTPYLESHHLISLSENGEDDLDNVCAICPNCHAKFHFGVNSDDLINNLLQKIQEKNRTLVSNI